MPALELAPVTRPREAVDEGARPSDEDIEALQMALASLPQVQPAPRRSPLGGPPTRPAPARPGPHAASPERLAPGPAAEPPRDRHRLVALAGAALVVAMLVVLGRSLWTNDTSADAERDAAPAGEPPPVTDAQLLAATADFVALDARTWLRLDERNHFGDMSAFESRAFLERLSAAGALTTNVGVPTDAAVRAGVLVLQHTPLHRDALLEAATAHPGGPVLSTACVQVGQRYMVLRLDGCD